MAERLMELKSKREEERRATVNHLNEKRFRETTDDLRKEDAKFYLQQVAFDREQQLREKRQKMEQEIMEEELYAQLLKQDIKAKEAREKKIVEEKKQTAQETLDILNWQKQQDEVKRKAELDAVSNEKNMLNTQWSLEA